MENSVIQLKGDAITIILAMPTAGKSFLQKEAVKVKGIKIFDTDDFYDHKLKANMTPEVKDAYLTGAFFLALYNANEWRRRFPEDKIVLLTNLWYRPITDIVKFDYAIIALPSRIKRLSEDRGNPISMGTATDWVASATEIWPRLGSRLIVLKDDQYLSDLINLNN